MVRLHRDQAARWFETPADATEFVVDRLSGKRPPEGLALSESRVRKEWFVRGKVPALSAATDYDNQIRTRLPLTYATWWRDPSNPLKNDAFLETLAASAPGAGLPHRQPARRHRRFHRSRPARERRALSFEGRWKRP
jgi:hypothetical protein